jgi:RNA polymerase sigma factor (sigma-70 family)
VTGLVVAASRAATGRRALHPVTRPAARPGHLRRAAEPGTVTAKPGPEGDASDVAWLVGRAAGGDRWAWERLVEKYAQLIWAMTRDFRLVESDAADVVQITWLRLLEHIDRLEQPARVGSWLAATARRECLRSLAARKRMVPVSDDATLDGVATHQPAVDEHLLADERAEAVRDAVSRLPRRWQRLIELLMSDPPASYAEISDQLGLPVGSIGPTRGRCLARLRVLLQASLACAQA